MENGLDSGFILVDALDSACSSDTFFILKITMAKIKLRKMFLNKVNHNYNRPQITVRHVTHVSRDRNQSYQISRNQILAIHGSYRLPPSWILHETN